MKKHLVFLLFLLWNGQLAAQSIVFAHQDSIDLLYKKLQIARENKEIGNEVILLRRLAEKHYDKGNHQKTLDFNLEELILREMMKDSAEMTLLHFYIGNTYADERKYDKAIQHYFEAIKINANPLISGVKVPTNIALLYLHQLNDDEKAKHYLGISLENAEKINDHEGKGKAYFGYGQLYEKRAEPGLAERFYKKAVEAYKIEGSKVKIGRCEMALGRLNVEMNEYSDALSHFMQANQLFRDGKYVKYEVRSLLELGKIFLELGNVTKAISYLKESISKSSVNHPDTENVEAYRQLARSYEKIGSFDKAMEFQKKFSVIQDSIYSRQQLATVIRMGQEIELLVQERDRMIQFVQLEKNNARLRLWIISLAALALLGFLATTFYFYRKRALDSLLVKSKELNILELEKLKKQQQLENAKSYIYGQTEERKRLSQELHDGLSLQLAQIKMKLSNIQYHLKEEKEQQKFDPIIEDLSMASSNVRDISHALSPAWLEKYGLVASINDLVYNLETSVDDMDIDFNHQGYGDQKISELACQSIYQTTSELLNNILKHSKARKVLIKLSIEHGVVCLEVEDNGIGYDSMDQKKGGIGLKNIRSRFAFLGGEFKISMKEKGGMLHQMRLPLSI